VTAIAATAASVAIPAASAVAPEAASEPAVIY
jgi:hypothetical protein